MFIRQDSDSLASKINPLADDLIPTPTINILKKPESEAELEQDLKISTDQNFSDNTRVAGINWATLKESAMQ